MSSHRIFFDPTGCNTKAKHVITSDSLSLSTSGVLVLLKIGALSEVGEAFAGAVSLCGAGSLELALTKGVR
jgi:hypothetical protein